MSLLRMHKKAAEACPTALWQQDLGTAPDQGPGLRRAATTGDGIAV